MSIERKLSGVARGPADVSWDLDYAYYSGGSEGNNSIGSLTYTGLSLAVSGVDTRPYGISISPDGTKMIYGGGTADRLFSYTLSTPFDISSASYDSVSYTLSQPTGGINGTFVRPDGLKAYALDPANRIVYQYSLGGSWDLSGTSYDSKSYDASATVPVGYGLTFSPDGTKMLIATSTPDIESYTLSTAWDVSTASPDGSPFNDGTAETAYTCIAFSEDGNAIYYGGPNLDSIHMAALSTPYDITTATYIGNVAAQNTSPESICLIANMLYVGCNVTVDTIYQYSLNNRGIEGLDGAAYTGKSFSTGITSYASYMREDGLKMYVADYQTSTTIREYTLSTAYDVSTASYSTLKATSSESTFATGVYFKPDGTKMYVLAIGNDAVYQYSLSTAWLVSTASYDSVSFSVSTQTGTGVDLKFSEDGLNFYVASLTDEVIYQYKLSIAWDLSTASFTSGDSFDGSSESTDQRGIAFSSDGSKLFSGCIGTDNFYMYRLTTPYEINTAIYTGVSVPFTQTNPQGITIANGFLYSISSGTIYQYVLGGVTNVADYPTNFTNHCISDDGKYIYFSNETSNIIVQYGLSTPFDISTLSPAALSSFNYGALSNVFTVGIKSDGTKLYYGDTSTVYQRSLSTAWDVSTAGAVTSYTDATNIKGIRDIKFSDDGTKMFTFDLTDGEIVRHTLSTAWDVTTASYDNSLVLNRGAGIDVGIDVVDGGSRIYSVDYNNNVLYEYLLSTPYDLTTASNGKSYDYSALSAVSTFTVRDAKFKPDGTGFYLNSQGNDGFFQFTIGIQE